MLRFFEKKVFGECKSQIFVIGDKNVKCGDCIAKTRRRDSVYNNTGETLKKYFSSKVGKMEQCGDKRFQEYDEEGKEV